MTTIIPSFLFQFTTNDSEDLMSFRRKKLFTYNFFCFGYVRNEKKPDFGWYNWTIYFKWNINDRSYPKKEWNSFNFNDILSSHNFSLYNKCKIIVCYICVWRRISKYLTEYSGNNGVFILSDSLSNRYVTLALQVKLHDFQSRSNNVAWRWVLQ